MTKEELRLCQFETLDATEQDIWSFGYPNDIRGGVPLTLGNMASGYPFSMGGRYFQNAECAFYCGMFAKDNPECIAIQEELIMASNAMKARRALVTKKDNAPYLRADFESFRWQWLLYIVWQKCLGNKSFRQLLQFRIPKDAVLVEIAEARPDKEGMLWGMKNNDLRFAREREEASVRNTMSGLKAQEMKRRIAEAVNRINRVGVWEGENNFGKILMACREALLKKSEPPIDYDLLREKRIFLCGTEIAF